MNESILSLSVSKILDKVFTPNVKGYAPEEVDSFLDQINQDYATFEKYLKESRDYIVSLETKLRKAAEKNKVLELENAKLHSRLDGIKDADHVNSTNIDLLDRISRLEKALYALGGDPTRV